MNDKEEMKVLAVICFLLLVFFMGMMWYVGVMGAQLQAVLHKHGW